MNPPWSSCLTLGFRVSREVNMTIRIRPPRESFLAHPATWRPNRHAVNRYHRRQTYSSLGCVLHEAFYGQRAFDGETSAARFRATIQQTPQPDPIRRRTDVGLADLISSCLQKTAEDRPKSASAVAAALRSPATSGNVFLTQIRWAFIRSPTRVGAGRWRHHRRGDRRRFLFTR